jgi:hypothetical protein
VNRDRQLKRVVRVVLALVVLLTTTSASADLLGDAERLEDAFRRAGATTSLLDPRFGVKGSTVTVPLRPRATPGVRDSAMAAGASAEPCLTVVVLAARNIPFGIRPSLPRSLGMAAPLEEAMAGHAVIEDCEGARLATGAVDIVVGKRTAAFEVLVARHAAGKRPSSLLVLPERAPGPSVDATGEVGPLRMAPIADRQARVERADRREGADFLARVNHHADARGAGQLLLRLREGCHRVHVLADREADVDVDADVRLPRAQEPMAQDGSQAPDASVEFCIGEDGEVTLRYAGVGGAAPVRVIVAHWSLPKGLPSAFGPTARGGLARALWRRGAPRVRRAPVLLVKGAAGSTVVPIEVAPNSCYLAAMALGGGTASGARLIARLPSDRRHDDTQDAATAATAVSFCTGPRDRRASIEVDLRADGAWWGLALWRMTRPR